MTIREIAKLANVSPATVSNVINGKAGKVSKENVQKILSIIEDTNYGKEKKAGISGNRINTKIIAGVVLNYSKENFLEDPFHSQFFGEVIRVIQEAGYYLMLLSVEDYDQAIKILKYWQVDGAIIVGAPDSTVHKFNNQIQIPIVFTDSYSTSGNINKVGTDDYGGGRLAARHLLDLGHKNVAVLSYWYSYSKAGAISERIKGFSEEFEKENIRLLSKNMFLVADERDSAFRNAAEEMKERLKEISALFCTSDRLAVHMMNRLLELDIRIPEDISIIGFDDSIICAHSSPGLTTIRQDIPNKARTSAQLLLSQIGREGVASESAMLPVSLVRRETTSESKHKRSLP
ncbi:LacI family transcriptional regulator [Kineothrix alysoides]|uniref:LacI family transcriptional regulator n=1 Tax=Kineothrix alysoides TaxID=1469948 RepID=A0A4R1R6L0_9FIRM|nr:LacI family DNA-binding transcriptional regulator [Kineothrix alysoides]TCL61158.1 LacI family transcriptional regulator [Kineothrix alysoides]